MKPLRASSLFVFLVLLSGCLQDAPSDTLAAVGSPRPVEIHDDIDLSTVSVDASWTVLAGAGFRDASLSFRLETLDGVPLRSEGQYCLRMGWVHEEDGSHAERHAGTGSCGDGNVAVSAPPLGGEVLYQGEGSEVAPGTYSFSFDAQPQAARLVVDLVVTY